MNRIARNRRGTALALMVLLWACDGSSAVDTVPVEGEMVLSVVSPHADDGALLLSIRGTLLSQPVTVNPDHRVFVMEGEADGNEWRVAIVGEQLSGDVLTFAGVTPDDLGAFDIQVLEVADLQNELRDDLTGYQVSIRNVVLED